MSPQFCRPRHQHGMIGLMLWQQQQSKAANLIKCPGTGRRKRRSVKNTPEPVARPLTRNGPELGVRGNVLCWEDGVYRRFSRRGLCAPKDPDLVVYTTEDGAIIFYEIHARLKQEGREIPSLQETMSRPDITLSRLSSRIMIGRVKL